ncbi:hypothetical protein INR77_02280 [Erythrobacter sp. SCSIO 43205]|uniref:hypothetical protein n=1 Tax=Erythrobacter sp. SCSIO 43205 TaxID=2779361 RepID=UPI001CAA1378|nr:hypothetical protein [Erythrobacter sp. SCSIO 43205]UAB78585.1 hypothetical protein INR77_02280 [Erythrobacter sp. SCSIO 43205]
MAKAKGGVKRAFGPTLGVPALGVAAALSLALPSAGLAVVGLADTAEPGAAATFELFTPTSVDPALAARVAEKARARGLSFTPLGTDITRASERTVTVAVRVDDDVAKAISVRSAIQSAPGTGKQIAGVQTSRFNLGTARGYQTFARTQATTSPSGRAAPVNELRTMGMPDLADFAPAGPTAVDKPSRLQPRIEIEGERVAGRSANTLDAVAAQTVDLGGSFSLSRKIDVTAGVRLSQERDRLDRLDPLTNSVKDSQAVYVGTQIKF